MTTKVTLKKQDIRGGSKTPKTLTSQGLLLKFLWERFGGIVECGKLLGTLPTNLANWRLRDGVPLEEVGPVSRKLKVPKEGLNFESVVLFEGQGKRWETVVSSYGFPPQIKEIIMKGAKPKSIEEILK